MTSKKYIFFDLVNRFKPHKKNVVIGTLCTFIFSFIMILRPIILRKIIDVYVPASDIDGIIKISLVYLFLLVVSLISSYFQVTLLSIAGVSVTNKLKGDLYKTIINLDREYFSKNPVGTLLARIESDTEQIKDMFSAHSIRLITVFVVMAGICISIYINTTGYAAYFFAILIFSLVFLFIMIKKIRKVFDKVRESYRKLSGFLTEYIRGIPTIQVFNVKNQVCKNLEIFNREKYEHQKKAAFMNYSFVAFLNLFTDTLVIAFIIYFGCKSIAFKQMTLGTMLMLIEYARILFHPLSHLSEELGYMQNSFVSLKRIYNVLSLKAEIKEGKNILDIQNDNISIKFEDVWFSYNKKDWILKGVSFEIPAKKIISIVGPSGSGKSTIIKLIFRLYDIDKGKILINGNDIREFTFESLRKWIGLVLQDVYFFPGSVYDNLSVLNNNVSKEQIMETAKKVGLDSFLNSFDLGLDSKLSEGGKNFSSGERQLFSFTRALSQNPSMIILDEATSFVDTDTEKKIQNCLYFAFENKSILIIAHRLSTVKNSDNIIVLKNGKVLEQGNHDELMGKKNVYYEMYSLQSITE